MFYEIRTQEEARSVGANEYFTGVRCKHGHLSTRFAKNGDCKTCRKIRNSKDHPSKHVYRKRSAIQLERSKLSQKNTRDKKPWIQILYQAKYRAKKMGLPFNLTEDWMKENWTDHCSLTGIKFEKGKSGKTGSVPFSRSLDKIDPLKGYVQDNCRFILQCINSFKSTMTDDEMKIVASRILKIRM